MEIPASQQVRRESTFDEPDCGRFEWAVLDWNEPAIGFYKKLGAVSMDDWTIFRVAGEALERLGNVTVKTC